MHNNRKGINTECIGLERMASVVTNIMTVINSKQKNVRILDACAIALLSVTTVFYIVNSFGDLGWEDESFYLTIPYRLLSGDNLLSDEWHLSQFSSLFLYLPVKIYTSLKGSADGILLFFRFLYLPIHLATSACVYRSVRSFGAASIAAAFLYALYVPMAILSVNYNSLCLTFIVLSSVVLIRACAKGGNAEFFFAGALFAMAVINNPALALAYFLYALIVAVIKISVILQKRRKPANTKRDNSRAATFFQHLSDTCNSACGRLCETKVFLLITVGIAAVAVIAVIYFFAMGGTPANIFKYVPHILSEPEHNYMGSGATSFFKLRELFSALFKQYPWQFPCFIAVLAACVIDRRKKLNILWVLCGFALFAAFLYKCIYLSLNSHETLLHLNWTLPMFVFGTVCFASIKDKVALVKPTVFFYIPGIIYSLCAFAASNMGIAALCLGYAVTNIAGCPYISYAAKEACDKLHHQTVKKAITVLFTILICCSFCTQAVYQTAVLFKAGYLTEVNYITIEKGPYSGLKVDSDFGKNINMIMSDIDTIKAQADSDLQILITGNMPWAYLYSGMRVGAPTCWQGALYTDRLIEYYKMNPENIPDYVYITAFSFPTYAYQLFRAKEEAEYFSKLFGCKYEQVRSGFIIKTNGTITE